MNSIAGGSQRKASDNSMANYLQSENSGTDDPFDSARETKHITRQIGIQEKCIFVLGLYSLGLTIVSYPIEFDEEYGNPNQVKSQILVTVSCMTMQLFLIVRNKYIVKLAVWRKEVPKDMSVLRYFPQHFQLFEQIGIFLHPNVAFIGVKIWIYDMNQNNYYFYHLNDLFNLIMQMKVLYLLTLITYKSKYGSTRAYRVCNMFGTRVGPRFIMKCLLRDNPIMYIFCILFSGVLFLGWFKNIAESPIDRLNLDFQQHTFFNSCWESIVTMSSVGYGDIYPKTYLGRMCSFLEIIFGVSVIFVA